MVLKKTMTAKYAATVPNSDGNQLGMLFFLYVGAKSTAHRRTNQQSRESESATNSASAYGRCKDSGKRRLFGLQFVLVSARNYGLMVRSRSKFRKFHGTNPFNRRLHKRNTRPSRVA